MRLAFALILLSISSSALAASQDIPGNLVWTCTHKASGGLNEFYEDSATGLFTFVERNGGTVTIHSGWGRTRAVWHYRVLAYGHAGAYSCNP